MANHPDSETSVGSPFDTVSEQEITRWDQYNKTVEEYVYAPLVIIWNDWRARIGLAILLLYLFMGTVGVVDLDVPSSNDGPQLLQPFNSNHLMPILTLDLLGFHYVLRVWEFPLGTDKLGRGIFKQVVHATPPMLKMILSGAIFSTVLATVVGTLSGYKGGWTDRVLMSFVDILMTIPGLPLVIVLGIILEPRSPYVIGVVITINYWTGIARSIRSQVLTIRQVSFIEASRTLGIDTPSILLRDVLPNLMPFITINFVKSARRVIFGSVALYFLGIFPFTSLNWGVMMNFAYTASGALYRLDTAHTLLIPMLAIVVLSFGLVLLAQSGDAIFNPRLRAKHAGSDDTLPGGDR